MLLQAMIQLSDCMALEKKASLSIIQSNDKPFKINNIFMQDQACMNDINKAGENPLVILYNSDSGDDHNAYHYKQF